jgi:hypothetical protein
MKPLVPHINLIVAWVALLLGFGSGAVMGMKFHAENWLGGYNSYKRRMYRLGHISFFGLAMVNLMFYFVAQGFQTARVSVGIASWSFVVGAVTMPICCALMAQSARWRNAFAVPVCSLISGAMLTLWEVIRL